MAIFKCKMCGGALEINNETVVTCEYCGTQQTLPKLDDERRANLYDRANHFRRNNEYDKAMDIYEQILNEDKTDAEAYWSLVLCSYGIEYVEDPASHKRIPTVNRAQFTSVFDNDNYKSALAYADSEQKSVYEAEAEAINEIQKGILAISQKEEPFDVFICYKETDNNGRRTPDSVLANDLYHQLTQEGFKVFFSRITLEDKLGTAYEPYIFAALNSAKVMVVLGTKPEFFNAVWVKNEWSRYLALVKNSNGKKMLIPAYKDMNPYDLPTEFSHLQAQDMSKLGFMQDLIRGIKKIAQADEPKIAIVKEPVVAETGTVTAAVAPLLRRVFMFLEDGDFARADDFCEQVLNQEPENAEAYLGKLMAELRVKKRELLVNCDNPFCGSTNYQKVLRFGSAELKAELEGYITTIKERNENNRIKGIYNQATVAMKSGISVADFELAAVNFKSISGYKDADELAEKCLKKAEEVKKDSILDQGKQKMNGTDIDSFESAIKLFESVSGWKDADECAEKCKVKLEELKAKAEADRIEAERQAELARIKAEKDKAETKKIVKIAAPIIAVIVVVAVLVNSVFIPNSNYNKAKKLIEEQQYNAAIAVLEELDGYKDSEELIKEANYKKAVELATSKDYDAAISLFKDISGYKDAETQLESCYSGKYGEETWNGFKNLKVGDVYTFGSYEQDNDTTNGKEEIEWIVLEKHDYKFLVVSKYALDCQPYNLIARRVQWSSCRLHYWLGSDFLKAAFTETEQSMIFDTTVSTDNNPISDTYGGATTEDKIFLLSKEESEKYFTSDDARMCKPTAYAKAQGAYSEYSENCWWWLRSPGGYSDYAIRVCYDGDVGNLGDLVDNTKTGVRPAMWIGIE